MVVGSAFVGVPGLRTFSLTASSFTPIEPLLFHLSEVAVAHGVLVAVGTADGFRQNRRTVLLVGKKSQQPNLQAKPAVDNSTQRVKAKPKMPYVDYLSLGFAGQSLDQSGLFQLL